MTLWEIEADGHGLKRLFAQEPFGSNACCGDWSPDGRYYVFSVDQAKQSSLWVVRDRPRVWERNQPVRLAEGPMDFWRAPIFTPDGRNILALGEHLRGESIKFDPKSGSFHPYPGAPSADTIAFSRDGQWMAYTTYPEGILWRSRVDGSDRLQLTTAPNISRFPQWSPDGTQLIYIAASGGNQWKIHKISANGGNSEVVLDDGSSQGVATWSPDGHHIAFGDIVVFGVGQQDGKQIRILDLDTKASTTLPGSEGLWTARWSPDGRYLSALTIDNRKLMLYDFNSGRWTQLANTGINDVVWSRDSRNIYFDSSDQASIYRVSVADKKVTEFATVGGIRRTGFFGTTLSIAPDNNLLLFQNVGGQEVYRLEVSLP
jgi:Tol biopolymer transport system component